MAPSARRAAFCVASAPARTGGRMRRLAENLAASAPTRISTASQPAPTENETPLPHAILSTSRSARQAPLAGSPGRARGPPARIRTTARLSKGTSPRPPDGRCTAGPRPGRKGGPQAPRCTRGATRPSRPSSAPSRHAASQLCSTATTPHAREPPSPACARRAAWAAGRRSPASFSHPSMRAKRAAPLPQAALRV